MSDRRVPTYHTDSVRISGLPELRAHLRDVVDDPAVAFDVKLLDDVELQLTEENIPPLLPILLPDLTQILKLTTQDPTPLLTLTIKLLSPLSFTRTLAIADPPSLLTALRSPLPGANLLALAILHKAAHTPSDAAILSTLPDLFEELVRTWLAASDVGVGERAARVLGDLLETDCEVVQGEGVNGMSVGGRNMALNGTDIVKRRLPGHARLWPLLFHHQSITSLIPMLCSTPTASPSSTAVPDSDSTPARTTHQVTISQGRLLRLVTRLATLDIRPLISTPLPALFPAPISTTQTVGQGVLPWAALVMVDKSDMLMHLSLIDFFESFISVMRASGRSPEKDDAVKKLVRAAAREDGELEAALRSLPDRTVEEEAEALRRYISEMMG